MKKLGKTLKNFKKWIIGIDEVGRGALAGPVLVAVVVIPHKIRFPVRGLPPLRDSKGLNPSKRRQWFEFIKKHPAVFYALARVNPKIIDRINIAKAANLAASRALDNLIAKLLPIYPTTNISLYLDGGLYITKNTRSRVFFYKIRTVIKGDEKYNVIKLASIVAKVSRDNYMKKLHRRYPHYGFDEHKGYGTKKHLRAIKKYGLSEVHRLTFIR